MKKIKSLLLISTLVCSSLISFSQEVKIDDFTFTKQAEGWTYVQTGKQEQNLNQAKVFFTRSSLGRLAFSPTDKRMLVSGANSLFLLDSTGNVLGSMSEHGCGMYTACDVNSMYFLADGKKVYSSSEDSFIVVWDTETFTTSQIKTAFGGLDFKFTQDQSYLIAYNVDHVAKYDLQGKEIYNLELEFWSEETTVTLSPDGSYFVVTLMYDSNDIPVSSIVVYDIKTGEKLYYTDKVYGRFDEPIISADSKYIVATKSGCWFDEGLSLFIWQRDGDKIKPLSKKPTKLKTSEYIIDLHWLNSTEYLIYSSQGDRIVANTAGKVTQQTSIAPAHKVAEITGQNLVYTNDGWGDPLVVTSLSGKKMNVFNQLKWVTHIQADKQATYVFNYDRSSSLLIYYHWISQLAYALDNGDIPTATALVEKHLK